MEANNVPKAEASEAEASEIDQKQILGTSPPVRIPGPQRRPSRGSSDPDFHASSTESRRRAVSQPLDWAVWEDNLNTDMKELFGLLKGDMPKDVNSGMQMSARMVSSLIKELICTMKGEESPVSFNGQSSGGTHVSPPRQADVSGSLNARGRFFSETPPPQLSDEVLQTNSSPVPPQTAPLSSTEAHSDESIPADDDNGLMFSIDDINPKKAY